MYYNFFTSSAIFYTISLNKYCIFAYPKSSINTNKVATYLPCREDDEGIDSATC